MIKSYVEIYKESDIQERLDIIKRFLDKAFPQYDFSKIDDYNVMFTKDRYQFYINKKYVGRLECDDVAYAYLEIESGDDKEINVKCYDPQLNKVFYNLLEIEDAHR